MRLALLTPSFLPAYNGMTFATMQHASMLIELGHQVTVVASCPKEQRQAVTAYLHERDINFLPVDISGSGLLYNPILGNAQDVAQQIVSLGLEMVMVEGKYFWGYHLIPLLRNCKVRIALVSHGAAPSQFQWSIASAAKWLVYGVYRCSHERRILSALDAVAVLSNHEDGERFSDASLYRRLGLNPLVVANTSIETVAREVRKTAGESGGLRIALVGDMSRTKNQLAAIGLAEKNNAISFVRFYFQVENEYSRLVATQANKKGVTSFQYCIGLDREAIIRSLCDIDLILCISKTEAQPLAIIDGLACGLPFLSTPVGCMSSMRGGLVSEVSEMRGIIQRLASDTAGFKDLTHEAKLFFKNKHSEAAVKQELTKFIELAMLSRN
jgi:hypothetical protein